MPKTVLGGRVHNHDMPPPSRELLQRSNSCACETARPTAAPECTCAPTRPATNDTDTTKHGGRMQPKHKTVREIESNTTSNKVMSTPCCGAQTFTPHLHTHTCKPVSSQSALRLFRWCQHPAPAPPATDKHDDREHACMCASRQCTGITCTSMAKTPLWVPTNMARAAQVHRNATVGTHTGEQPCRHNNT